MRESRKSLPSVLLAILSTLGILFGVLAIGFSLANMFILPENSQYTSSDFETFSSFTSIVFFLAIVCVNIFTLIITVNHWRGEPAKPEKSRTFSKKWVFLLLWVAAAASGFYVSQHTKWHFLLAILTIFSIGIPIFILINMARSGFPRGSRQKELGVLTIGSNIAPIIIIVAEIIFILTLLIIVIFLVGGQEAFFENLPGYWMHLSSQSGSIEALEIYLFELMRQPVIATAVFLSLGVIAPLIEESIKPLGLWFLTNRRLEDHEGYTLGLISGGAFAFVESMGIAIQLEPQSWLQTIILRFVTAALHIGLSGMVGFGIIRGKSIRKPALGLMMLLAAAALHGLWNSLAIYSGMAAFSTVDDSVSDAKNFGVILSVFLMILVFLMIVLVNFFIRRYLQRNLQNENNDGIILNK